MENYQRSIVMIPRPYVGQIVEEAGAPTTVVAGQVELEKEVARILAAAPMIGKDMLPLSHHALVVVGENGLLSSISVGALAVHVGALESAMDLKLYKVVQVEGDRVDLKEIGPLFPRDVKRCRLCGLLLIHEPYFSTEDRYGTSRYCPRCFANLKSLAETIDWSSEKWSFHKGE